MVGRVTAACTSAQSHSEALQRITEASLVLSNTERKFPSLAAVEVAVKVDCSDSEA